MTNPRHNDSDLKARALRFLSRRAHSRQQLRTKLLRHATAEAVDPLLDSLEARGWLDDEAFSLQRALSCRRHRHWGDRRIRQDLKRLGIDARMIERILARLEAEESQSEGLQEAISRWVDRTGAPETVSQIRKLYEHCIRLGYPPSLVRDCLEPFFRDTDWTE